MNGQPFEAYCAECGWHFPVDRLTGWCEGCTEKWQSEIAAREGAA